MNAVDSGICIIDQQGVIQLANPALIKLCELPSSEIKGMDYHVILPKESVGASMIQELAEGTRDEFKECKTWWKSSEAGKYIKGYALEIEEEFGKWRTIVLKDISEEVEQRELLRHQSDILNNVQDSIIVTDEKGVINYWNDAATKLFGYTEEEMLGAHMHKLNPAFDPQGFITMAGDNKNFYRRGDWKYTRADGQEVWADVKVNLMYDESCTEVIGFIGVSKDITGKKKHEHELLNNNKELASLIDSQTNFLVRIDLEGNILFANRHYLESFGYDESIIGKNYAQEIHPDDVEMCQLSIEKCRNNPGQTIPIEIRRPNGKGSYGTNYWEFVCVANEDSEVVELQGIGYDITERKEAEQKIQYLKSFNGLLLEISNELVNLSFQSLEKRIMKAMGDVAEFTHFERSLLYLFDEETEESKVQYEYCAEGVSPSSPQTHKYPAGNFAWWTEKIYNQEAVEISDKEDLPEEAQDTKKEMDAYGVSAMINIPVAYQQEVMGFLVFVSLKEGKSWDQDTITLLKILGAILANAIYRNRTIKELEDSRDRYMLLAENVSDMLVKHDTSLKVNFITPSCKEMLEYQPDEIISTSFADLIYPEDIALVSEHVKQALAGKHIRFTTRLRKKNGSYIWVEGSAKAFDNQGNTEIIAVLRDIHVQKLIEIEKDELFKETHALNEELRASEEELRQTLDRTVELNNMLAHSERKFKGLIEKSFDGIVVYGSDASIQYLSPSATQMIGYTQEEARKMTGRDLIHPDDLPTADERMAKLIQQPGSCVFFEVRSICKDGSVIWLETHIANLLEDPAIRGLVANFRDITEKKNTDLRLEGIRTSLNMAQKIARVGSWELEIPSMKAYLSDEFYNLLAVNRNNTEEINFIDFVHPEDRGDVQKASDAMMHELKIADLEYRIIDNDGQLKYLRAHTRSITNERGEIVKLLGTIQDVTKETELERLLEETSKLAKVGGWEVNLLTNELTWTKETYAMHDVPFGQALNVEEAKYFYHPDDRPIIKEVLEDIANKKIIYDLELRIITAKGKLKWIRTSGGIASEVNGKVTIIRGSIQDITERKQREEEIKKYSDRLALATGSANIGVWDLDIEHNKFYWDQQTSNILGIDAYQEGTLEELKSIFHPEDEKIILKAEALKKWKRDTLNLEFRIIRPDNGEVKHIKSSAKVMFDNLGKAARMIGVHWDITSLKEKEKRLQMNNEELRKTNAELDHFVYSTSHNLRAPLTSIMGIVDVLGEAKTEDEKKQLVDLIRKSIYKLDETIQEINDYSRNTRIAVKSTLIDFASLVDNISESLSYMQNARDLKLDLHIPEGLVFYSDIGRLKIILNNLFSNAIKYTNPINEFPFVSVNIEQQDNGILLQIRDNGIGIKAEYLDKIFDMFFRATSRSSGSGLGLYIVKEAVEKLGGEIQVKSVVGEGSEFNIRLPNLK